MEFELLDYVPEKPARWQRGKYKDVVEEFREIEDMKTLVFKLKNADEYKRCYNSVAHYLKYHHLPLTLWGERARNRVYLIKGE